MIEEMKIGITFQLTNLVSKELESIAKQMIGIDKSTMNTIKNLGSFKAAVLGISSMAFGGAIIDGMYKMARAGGELETQLSHIKNQFNDISAAQMDSVRKSSISMANASGGLATPAQAAETIGEIATITKDVPESVRMAPDAIKLIGSLMASLGKNWDEASKDYLNIIRAAEMNSDNVNKKTGKIDASQLFKSAEMTERELVSLHGMISSNDLLQAEKMGSNVYRQMGFEQKAQFDAGLISEFGGSKLGTAIQAFGQQFIAKVMQKRVKDSLEKQGFMDSKGNLVGQDLLDQGKIRDFFDLFRTEAQTAYKKFARKGQTEENFNSELLGQIIGQGTARRLFGTVLSQQPVMEKEAAAISKTGNLDQQLQNSTDNNMGASIGRLGTALKGFFQTLGDPLVKPTINIINQLTKGVNFLTRQVIEHPEATKILLEMAAGIGAAMIAIGGLAAVAGAFGVIAAVFGAPVMAVVAGVSAVAAVFVGLFNIIKNWDFNKSILGNINDMFVRFDKWTEQMNEKIYNVLSSLFGSWWKSFEKESDKLDTMIGKFFDGIWTSFEKQLSKLYNHIRSWLDGDSGVGGQLLQESFKYDPSANNNRGVQQINLMVDGKRMASVVTDRMGNVLSRNTSAPTGFNTRASPTPPGLVAV